MALDPTEFTFAHRQFISSKSTSALWERWSALFSWHEWDKSLAGTHADNEGLVLGKRFSVVPHGSAHPIPVTIVSMVDGQHFTTASAGPMGLVSFGHALVRDDVKNTLVFEHSVCVVPTDPIAFKAQHWDRIKNNVEESVESLAFLIEELETR